ncbi:hypothetical protein ACHMW7_08645 [Aminobacter sp. UC22_36]|uniref:hypothetical protein n=1 Tax=Aminobacter sp. UC22_36 TaxID=3374549 RepID=UPI0037579DEA
MAEQRKARPVSGEIMTDAGRDTSAHKPRVDACDIIDADFEDVTPPHRRNESAAEVPPVFSNPSADAGGMEMLRSASRHPTRGLSVAGRCSGSPVSPW